MKIFMVYERVWRIGAEDDLQVPRARVRAETAEEVMAVLPKRGDLPIEEAWLVTELDEPPIVPLWELKYALKERSQS